MIRNQQSETVPLFHDVHRFRSVLQTFGIYSRLNSLLKIHTYLNHVFLFNLTVNCYTEYELVSCVENTKTAKNRLMVCRFFRCRKLP